MKMERTKVDNKGRILLKDENGKIESGPSRTNSLFVHEIFSFQLLQASMLIDSIINNNAV